MDPRLTQALQGLEAGDPESAQRLLPLVYDELKRIADQRMRAEAPGHSLQATALLHEAYLRLLGPESDGTDAVWANRAHFFAAAAEAMRRVLIDRARARLTDKRGGGAQRLTLDPDNLALNDVPPELIDLDDALVRLGAADPVKAELVKLRFYAGLTLPQAAAALGLSTSTAERHWSYARAWLYRQLAAS